MHSTGTDIEGVLSVVLPESLKTGDLNAIEGSSFRYATHYLNAKGESTRWPQRRRLEGGVDDLADAIEYLSLSEQRVPPELPEPRNVPNAGVVPWRDGLAERDSP